MPKIVAAINEKDYGRAISIMQTAASVYYDRISLVEATVPGEDAAIIAKLHQHIAAEIMRASPAVAEQVKTLEPIKFPPIEYKRKK